MGRPDAHYAAVGFVIVQWSFLDAALDHIVSAIYTDFGGKALRKSVPKFQRDKLKFIANAAETLPALASRRDRLLQLAGQVAQHKDYREAFAHSVHVSMGHVNGVFAFARMDAKQDRHEVTTWLFDIRDFDGLAALILGLVSDAQDLANDLREDQPA